ncbi:MAG: pyruvate formate lyase-activating enzyme 1 [Firmicutes bacterium ADurb.Bin182]|nr:MAG: pyruvate formate lyase-activating enzyme 1 [Firmicutes bacterium ADurb.Bin182]
MKAAMYYEKANDTDVRCMLCPHGCFLKPGQTGICRARKNIEGELYSINYGKMTSLALDPIEKKPLVNFHPGSYILSAGSFGCNLKCSFCQNWRISQAESQSADMTPEALVEKAVGLLPRGNIGIAYTYNEPLIWYEFVRDCSLLAHENGLLNVLVTNGYIQKEPMEKLLPFVDAMNIDLKAFSSDFYKSICKGEIDFVMNTIRLCAEACHVEVTNLLIPGENDSEEEVSALSSWLAEVSQNITLHLTAYHPDYKMKKPGFMSRKRMFELINVAKKHLKNVYCGNMHILI